MHKRHLIPIFICSFLFAGIVHSEDDSSAETTRVQWQMDETYEGQHPQSFQKLRFEVPVLIRQTTIDIAVRLGLNFQEGWRYPITIRFVDANPPGIENALAYTQIGQTAKGFVQYLDINLSAYESEQFNFKKVFAHELVHAMMNDSLGAEASIMLPVWLHEGLAVYGADQGEQMIRSYASYYPGFAESRMLNGLEGPHGAIDYAEDYLAIKYIYAKHGVSALHNFVRELVRKNGNVEASLKYTCLEDWPTYQANARAFAQDQIHDLGVPERGVVIKPY